MSDHAQTLAAWFFVFFILGWIFGDWLRGAMERCEIRESIELAESDADFADDPGTTTYWYGHEPISRAEYRSLGGAA